MNKTSILLLLPFALAANPVFNGSFELGTDGFALERELRPATNPSLKFTPLKLAAGAPGAGKHSLMIENPYAEFFGLFSREFKLKPTASLRNSRRRRAATRSVSPSSKSMASGWRIRRRLRSPAVNGRISTLPSPRKSVRATAGIMSRSALFRTKAKSRMHFILTISRLKSLALSLPLRSMQRPLRTRRSICAVKQRN